MDIGVIGTGRIGSTLAGGFARAGHRVAIANSHGPQSLRELELELGDRCTATTPEDAVRRSDVVVLALPFGHFGDFPGSAADGKTVIDATNYDPRRDGHFPHLDDGTETSSELIQHWLDHAHVVKAFNAMRWDHLRDYGHEGGATHRYGIAVSGDAGPAKRQVFDLIEELGYEPVDAGNLAEGGRKHQPGTDVFLADLWAEDLRSRVGVLPA
jgi:predicted dinucleotide-binding enzyme